MKAIERIEVRVASLANGLHAVECCLISLEKNAKNELFQQISLTISC